MDQSPDVVAAAFRRRPVTWLRPFLHLAWQDGHRDRTSNATDIRDTRHEVRLRAAPAPAAPGATYELRWDAMSAAERVTLTGNLTISPLDTGTVVAIVADVAGRHTDRTPTALRAEELIVRSLLGHLRNAFEASMTQA